MLKFWLPKQFFINEKKIHKNLNENLKGIYTFGRFNNGNIIINYFDDETVILDKNYEILYKENIGNFHFLTIINNDQFIAIKDEGMFLFSFIYSNCINSDNPSEPLNQKKIIKIISELFYKLNKNNEANIFYDKNNKIIALIKYYDINLSYIYYNCFILVFDVFKNKISLKAKLKSLDNDLYKCVIFRNKYLIVSKQNSLKVFNVYNMKEICPGVNNLKLNNKDYIIKLMNLNNEFLLILTEKK